MVMMSDEGGGCWSEDDDDYNSEMMKSSATANVKNHGTEFSTTSNAIISSASDLLISASDKAGMAGIDRARINAILLRESGNSTFMQRQRKADESCNRKIETMKHQLTEKDDNTTADWRQELNKSTIDPILQNCNNRRRPYSTCVVVDMDSFFISCHILTHPHLATIPACVGGSSMISTSNYVARQYGVRAAMPGYLGQKLVAELSHGKETLTFVKSDFELYKRKSNEVRAILEEYDPKLRMGSLDEAYMDIGPYLEIMMQLMRNDEAAGGVVSSSSHDDIRKLLQSSSLSSSSKLSSLDDIDKHNIHSAAQDLLHSIRERVKTMTGLTCTAGLASNYHLAKIASDINKPNGQYFVGSSENEIIQFIHPLSIRKINGIGRVMEKTLRGVLNIETVVDLYNKRADIYFLYKPASSNFLLRASIGYSDDHLNSTTDNDDDNHDKNTTNEAMNRKGMSHERTFTPTSCWSTLCTNLEKIATCLANDLREKNLRPKTITLKVKLDTFDILTRAMTRDVALFQNCNQSESCQTLVDIAIGLLKEAKREHEQCGPATKKPKSATAVAQKTLKPFSIRLLGVRCSNFQLHDDMQQSLLRYGTATWGERDCVVQTRPTTPTHDTDRTTGPVMRNPYLSPLSTSRQDNDSKMKQYEQINSHGNERVKCPMCQDSFPNNDNGNLSLNAHIDECLNLATVKQLVNEETMCADEKVKNKKRRLTDFFAS